MSVKFYRNSIPTQAVYLSGLGIWLQFEQVSDDIGIFKTTREDVQKELAAAASRQVSGIQEVDEAAYNMLLDSKKNWTPSSPSWREEFSLGQVSKLMEVKEPARVPDRLLEADAAQAAAGVAKLRAKIEQSELPKEHKPVVRRKTK